MNDEQFALVFWTAVAAAGVVLGRVAYLVWGA